MWSNLLLPLLLLVLLLLLQFTNAMSTAHGGLTVIDGSSTTTTISSSSSSSTTKATTSSSRVAAPSVAASTTSVVLAAVARKRHRKRNSSWDDYRNYNENTTALEWVNPCGGSHVPPTYHAPTQRRRAHRPKEIFKILQRNAGTEYRFLNNSHEHKDIDIRDMQMWSLHNPNYKFLPKLKPNSTIALKRWYRNMQTYVASFAYLRRVQINWDRHYQKRESPMAKELKALLISSRSMLCELETAVNNTYPAMAMGPGAAATAAAGRAAMKQRRQMQLPQISRSDMNKRLKLRSKRRPAATATAPAAAAAAVASATLSSSSSSSSSPSSSSSSSSLSSFIEADSIDVRFVKHHYYEFLRTMWQLLRRDSKRERQQRRQRSEKRQRQQQQQRQQRQQQQPKFQQQQQQQQQLWQQQRLPLSLANRKEFNEVSKPLLDAAVGGSSATLAGTGRRGKRQQPAALVSSLSVSSASKLTSASASTSASTSASASASASTSASAATHRHQRRVLRT